MPFNPDGSLVDPTSLLQRIETMRTQGETIPALELLDTYLTQLTTLRLGSAKAAGVRKLFFEGAVMDPAGGYSSAVVPDPLAVGAARVFEATGHANEAGAIYMSVIRRAVWQAAAAGSDTCTSAGASASAPLIVEVPDTTLFLRVNLAALHHAVGDAGVAMRMEAAALLRADCTGLQGAEPWCEGLASLVPPLPPPTPDTLAQELYKVSTGKDSGADVLAFLAGAVPHLVGPPSGGPSGLTAADRSCPAGTDRLPSSPEAPIANPHCTVCMRTAPASDLAEMLLTNLAAGFIGRGHPGEAVPLLRRALELRKQALAASGASALATVQGTSLMTVYLADAKRAIGDWSGFEADFRQLWAHSATLMAPPALQAPAVTPYDSLMWPFSLAEQRDIGVWYGRHGWRGLPPYALPPGSRRVLSKSAAFGLGGDGGERGVMKGRKQVKERAHPARMPFVCSSEGASAVAASSPSSPSPARRGPRVLSSKGSLGLGLGNSASAVSGRQLACASVNASTLPIDFTSFHLVVAPSGSSDGTAQCVPGHRRRDVPCVPPPPPTPATASTPHAPRRRLRLSYVTCDTSSAHPTANMLVPVALDDAKRGGETAVNLAAPAPYAAAWGARVDSHVVTYGPSDGTPVRRMLEELSTSFTSLIGPGNAEAATAILASSPHFLFDLQGHTRNARPEVLAHVQATTSGRPPIQVGYIAVPGTIGAPQTAYTVIDAGIVPPDAPVYASGPLMGGGSSGASSTASSSPLRTLYSEALVYMPGYYLTKFFSGRNVTGSSGEGGQRSLPCPSSSSPPAAVPVPTFDPEDDPDGSLEDGAAADAEPIRRVAFFSSNKIDKLDPTSFALWMDVLARVPGSVLQVVGPRPGTASAEALLANMAREAAAAGVHPSRFVFLPQAPLEVHTARMAAADLHLDPFVCNSHSSAYDAWRAGLPVLAMEGDGWPRRVAARLADRTGQGALFTVHSAQAYADAAVQLVSPVHGGGSTGALYTDVVKARLAEVSRCEAVPSVASPSVAAAVGDLFDEELYRADFARAVSAMWEVNVLPTLPAAA